jgi:hypothetical protein
MAMQIESLQTEIISHGQLFPEFLSRTYQNMVSYSYASTGIRVLGSFKD